MEKFEPSNFATHSDELAYLEQMGFPTNNEIMSANSIEEVWQTAEKFQTEGKNLSYQIDGMVVKLNDNRLAYDLGIVGKTPRAWCAVKFAPEEVTTKVVGVTWQVGRTGKITPVAELEPILLVGTIVKRATLHNYKEFVAKDLIPGDTVVVRKAGEIIPEILQVLYNLRETSDQKSFVAPENCPTCQTRLEISTTEVDLICPNSLNCRAQVLGRLTYFTSRNIANIVGLSEKQIEKFIDSFEVQDLPDLYKLPFDRIADMEGFGPKSAQNLEDSISNAYQIEDYRLLAGLCIEGVGVEVAKLICRRVAEKQAQANEGETASETGNLFD